MKVVARSISKENEFQKLVEQTVEVIFSGLLPFCICVPPAIIPVCTSCGNKKTAAKLVLDIADGKITASQGTVTKNLAVHKSCSCWEQVSSV